jgi:uncharacterized protein
MPNGNVQIVRDCYQAFQENDLEAMFAVFAPDIAWESVGRRDDFPTLGSRRGIAQVREVFRLVAENLEFHTFTPSELHGVGNIVFAMGRYEMTVRKTGRRAGSDWLHVFWVKQGKVTRFREFTDTARFAEAWRG